MLPGLLVAALAAGCGGGLLGGGNPPGPPQQLAVNAGDGAVSLAWAAPSSEQGAAVTGYAVSVTPGVASSKITLSGTTAVVDGLTNGVTYSFSVAATSLVGTGTASAAVQAVPQAVTTGNYVRIAVTGDPNAPSGIFDPSIVNSSGATVWLAYSSVHDYYDASNELVRDVSTSIARSVDGGQTFQYLETVGLAHGPVAVTDTSLHACGQANCTGRWVYEVPFLLEDSADPSAARRYKLFAHKYFLYPPGKPDTQYALGAIVMWTANSPDGTWSQEIPVLQWNATPPEISGGTNITAIDPALASCLLLTEGTAALDGSAIDFAFNCTYANGTAAAVKLVMLRSADHAGSFSYVSTPLSPGDAAIFPGAAYFNAPALLPTPGGAPVLLVTPDDGVGMYLGCVVIPFANAESGTLIRDGSNRPVPILTLPTLDGHFGGACAWDRGLSTTGILMDDYDPAAPVPFGIVATGAKL